ncbi:Scalloped [Gryllus bimaculatus]|nr:Scalloped [Gryllus bimaculatus]
MISLPTATRVHSARKWYGCPLVAGKISSPWTPASAGPPADSSGAGADAKNLDVGDEVSEERLSCLLRVVSSLSSPRIIRAFVTNRIAQSLSLVKLRAAERAACIEDSCAAPREARRRSPLRAVAGANEALGCGSKGKVACSINGGGGRMARLPLLLHGILHNCKRKKEKVSGIHAQFTDEVRPPEKTALCQLKRAVQESNVAVSARLCPGAGSARRALELREEEQRAGAAAAGGGGRDRKRKVRCDASGLRLRAGVHRLRRGRSPPPLAPARRAPAAPLSPPSPATRSRPADRLAV